MSSHDRRYQGYRADTIRLDGWDYRRSAWYFVTICAHDRIPYFGRVRNGIVGLSAAGCIAAQEWQRTPQVRPYVRLDAWVVMPNHVHGIIGITTESPAHAAVDASRRDASTHEHNPTDKFRLRAHSVGAIVGQYKSMCTKRIRAACAPDFAWQSRFYDRIVRTPEELQAIRRYIHYNPATWADDGITPP